MKIIFSWNELPKYAAYLLQEIVIQNPDVEIVSIKSKLPIKNVENILSKKIHWIENKKVSFKEIGLSVPDLFFQAGWYKKSFKSLGDEVRRNGGNVVLLSDNKYRGDFKQFIGSIIYRVMYLKAFKAVWVPGASGRKLMNKFGVNKNNIYEGLYASNENIYYSKEALSNRNKTFLYVGQFNNRKGFRELLYSFCEFIKTNPEWTLTLIGTGPLDHIVPESKNIIKINFTTPEEVAKYMRSSRFLILPSKNDNWPLVVSEAAMCGCGLILSDKVGNIEELANKSNSFILNYKIKKSLVNSMKQASLLNDTQLNIMHEESLKLGSNYTIQKWMNRYRKLESDFY